MSIDQAITINWRTTIYPSIFLRFVGIKERAIARVLRLIFSNESHDPGSVFGVGSVGSGYSVQRNDYSGIDGTCPRFERWALRVHQSRALKRIEKRRTALRTRRVFMGTSPISAEEKETERGDRYGRAGGSGLGRSTNRWTIEPSERLARKRSRSGASYSLKSPLTEARRWGTGLWRAE